MDHFYLFIILILVSLLSKSIYIVQANDDIKRLTDKSFVYIHVPKTGGTSLRYHIPNLLDLVSCNSKYDIANCCPVSIPKMKDKFFQMKYPNFGQTCQFLVHEWKINLMSSVMKSIGYNPGSYNVLASFREPITHFFSAFEHIQANDDPKVTLDSLLFDLKNNQPSNYDLRNFQSSFISNTISSSTSSSISTVVSLNNTVENMRKLYWFAISDDYELSLKLLQCQVYGKINDNKLKLVLSHPYNVRSSQTKSTNYKFSAQNLVDIKALNKLDIQFYEMVILEFRLRVYKYSACLNATTDVSYMKNTLTSIASS